MGIEALLSQLRPKHFVARSKDGSVLHEGITPPCNVTVTGQPVFKQTVSEVEHMANINEVVEVLAPLPEEGTELEQGHLYRWNDRAIKVRQSHTRTHHDPDMSGEFNNATDARGYLINTLGWTITDAGPE